MDHMMSHVQLVFGPKCNFKLTNNFLIYVGFEFSMNSMDLFPNKKTKERRLMLRI